MEGISTSNNPLVFSGVRHIAGQAPRDGSGTGRTGRTTGSNSAGDTVTVSPEARRLSRDSKVHGDGPKDEPASPSETSSLTEEELRELTELKTRDAEVRAHEQAHLSAAGGFAAGGAGYTFQQGPDGKRYAVGGEVPIDVGKERTPQATIEKMQTIRRAALAPANPSAADRQIAAQASATEAQARQEVLTEEQKAATKSESTQSPEEENRAEISTDSSGQISRKTLEEGTIPGTSAAIAAYTAINTLG